jgi:Uma2 family endonuclease
LINNKTPYICIQNKEEMGLQLDLTKRYTFADYFTWHDDKRRELIDGFIQMMSPGPTSYHQSIAGNLLREISWYLKKKKKYKIFIAPFDVRLPNSANEINNDQIYTVVQPDICVICDLSKIDIKGCIGAPDMIIEIVSPATAKRDVEEKFQLYQKHGVREYWIVFPEDRSLNVFVLDENLKYKLVGMYANDSKVKVNILEDLVIDLAEVFED